jgi:hypothetical protein
VRLWDVPPSGQEGRAWDFRGQGGAQCVAFSPEGRYLAVGLRNGPIAILHLAP